MLTKADIATIAALAKIPVETIQAAIDAKEETPLTIPEKLSTFTEAEVTTLKNNEYKRGKEVGPEMLVKDTAKAMGLDYTGNKLDGLIEAANKKALADAGKTTTEKENELTARIATLQGTVSEITTKLTESQSRMAEMQLTGDLSRHIPAIPDGGVKLSHNAILGLMKGEGYTFKTEEGVQKAYLNGQLVQDKIGNARPVGDVFTDFMKAQNILTEAKQGPAPAGRGGKTPAPAGGKWSKLSELRASFEAEGKSIQGEEFNKAVREAKAANKDFDFNA